MHLLTQFLGRLTDRLSVLLYGTDIPEVVPLQIFSPQNSFISFYCISSLSCCHVVYELASRFGNMNGSFSAFGFVFSSHHVPCKQGLSCRKSDGWNGRNWGVPTNAREPLLCRKIAGGGRTPILFSLKGALIVNWTYSSCPPHTVYCSWHSLREPARMRARESSIWTSASSKEWQRFK